METLAEIQEAIKLLSVSGMIRLLRQQEADVVLKQLKRTFIEGTPSNLWHSFLKPSLPVDAVGDEAIQDFINMIFNSEDLIYLILEEDDYYILELEPKRVFEFLLECRYIVYYITDTSFTKLLCENDHNHVMYIEC